jgi:hypothetical protein
MSAAGKSKKLLPAVTSEHESDNQSQDAIDRICKSIKSVHSRSRWTMSILSVKPVALQ